MSTYTTRQAFDTLTAEGYRPQDVDDALNSMVGAGFELPQPDEGDYVLTIAELVVLRDQLEADPTLRVETVHAASGQVVEIEHMSRSRFLADLGGDLSAEDLGCEPGTVYTVRAMTLADDGEVFFAATLVAR
jgi:hypothetical protein